MKNFITTIIFSFCFFNISNSCESCNHWMLNPHFTTYHAAIINRFNSAKTFVDSSQDMIEHIQQDLSLTNEEIRELLDNISTELDQCGLILNY